jgi:hypothetical protein
MQELTWRKLNEQVPPEDGKYIVYAPSADDEKPLIAMAWWHAEANAWGLLPQVWCDGIEQWMPLPSRPSD